LPRPSSGGGRAPIAGFLFTNRLGDEEASVNIVALIIQVVSGAVGGNIAGTLLKQFSLGPVGNSIVGILGGGVGGQLLGMLGAGGMGAGAGTSGLDIGAIVSSIVGGGVGGGVLMAIIGLARQLLAKS
jgi:hypothetical protein